MLIQKFEVTSQGTYARWDHALSYVAASEPRFLQIVDDWVNAGLAEYEDPTRVVALDVDKQLVVPGDASRKVAVATGEGWHELCERWVDPDVRVVRPAWVARMSRTAGERWLLGGSDVPGDETTFDYVVISHNGKCAARLIKSSEGAAGVAVEKSVQCAFGARPREQLAKQRRLILSSIWSVGIAFPAGAVNAPFDSAHISGGDGVLAYAKRNKQDVDGVEVWSLLSTAEYGKANKVPQERVPRAKGAEVTNALLDSFALALRASGGSLDESAEILSSKYQLWGAALPLTVTRESHLLDLSTRVGVCGDWMGTGDARSPSAQSAVLSGEALADAVAANLASDDSKGARYVKWRTATASATALGDILLV